MKYLVFAGEAKRVLVIADRLAGCSFLGELFDVCEVEGQDSTVLSACVGMVGGIDILKRLFASPGSAACPELPIDAATALREISAANLCIIEKP